MTDLPSFDELKALHESDPKALEDLRKKVTTEVIESAPEENQRKLRGLQWKIDAEVAKSKSRMAACIAISGMMHDSFDQLREALNDLTGVVRSKSTPKPDPITPKIVPFNKGENRE